MEYTNNKNYKSKRSSSSWAQNLVYGIQDVGSWLSNAWTDTKNLWGINERENAITDQQRMTDMQIEANKEMADYGIEINSAKNQMKRLDEAGLNPALMYGGGGAGGSTVATQGVSGGQASNSASREQNKINSMGMALQLAKLRSEIDVNKSVADVNKANAENAGSRTITENDFREIQKEKLRQEGTKLYLENAITKFGMENDVLDPKTNYTEWSAAFGDVWIKADSTKKQELVNAILISAEEVISVKKHANAAETNAKAAELNALTKKLEMEFATGKNINWKNIGELLPRILMLLK